MVCMLFTFDKFIWFPGLKGAFAFASLNAGFFGLYLKTKRNKNKFNKILKLFLLLSIIFYEGW